MYVVVKELVARHEDGVGSGRDAEFNLPYHTRIVMLFPSRKKAIPKLWKWEIHDVVG